MRGARIAISYNLLEMLLRFPRGARIVQIDGDWRGYFQRFYVYVEHPDFEEVEEGMMVPIIEPTWTETEDGLVLDWGLEVKHEENQSA